jgi:hypothetical protein
MSKSNVKLLARPRNLLVLNPLLSKGGKHEKSGKAKRAESKQQTRREIRGF